MKYKIILFAAMLGAQGEHAQGVLDRLHNKVKDKATQRAENRVDQAIDKGLDKAEQGAEKGATAATKSGGNSGGGSTSSSGGSSSGGSNAGSGGGQTGGSSGSFKAYNNYDFIPGEKVIFEDNFRDDQDGEFPAHWKMEGGQGVVNTMGDDRVFAITQYYSIFSPNVTKTKYLGEEYTIEFDQWLDRNYDSNEGVFIIFRLGKSVLSKLHTSNSAIFLTSENGNKINGKLPGGLEGAAFLGSWHHFAIAVKGKQMKVYCDQYRVLVAPDCGFKADNIAFAGDASEGMSMLFKNVRVAEGGGMNMLGKKFTDTKIVTHGINFDYNKASIKPESMGTLNGIFQIMKENPDLKFEVGGHTDTDGDDAYNMKLSQQRADAVKAQLITMGVAANRLTAKGYGESKPISDNKTTEGKANNRRVEFVKQ